MKEHNTSMQLIKIFVYELSGGIGSLRGVAAEVKIAGRPLAQAQSSYPKSGRCDSEYTYINRINSSIRLPFRSRTSKSFFTWLCAVYYGDWFPYVVMQIVSVVKLLR